METSRHPLHAADFAAQEMAVRIIDTLMRGYPGAMPFRLWNGTRHAFGPAPSLTLMLRHPSVLRRLDRLWLDQQMVYSPGGLFLNHGITHDEDGWNRNTVASEFINRYVFPDGELDRVSNIQLAMEQAGLEIIDQEGLRPHYALTLRHWVSRLEAHREAAVAEVGEAACRVWRLYMAGCAVEFESGGTGVYRILASRPYRGAWSAPLTREDIYQ